MNCVLYVCVCVYVCVHMYICAFLSLSSRLEEESNAAQKLAQDRATAETKIKGLEEQMTIQEDSISKVCVWVCGCGCVRVCVCVHACTCMFCASLL